MKRTLIAVTLVALAAAPALAHGWSRGAKQVRSCADWNVHIDGQEALTTSESLNVSASGSLEVDAAPNGGISVVRGSGKSYAVTLCKAVSADLGQSALAQVRIVDSGGRLSVAAPGDRGWSAHFIIEAPAGADLRIRAHNGPIGVSGFEGVLDAKTANGPLTLTDVSGTIKAHATNGPVSLTRASGSVEVKTTNGPLSVKLDQVTWLGTGLEASTTNGPLTLEIPRGFASSTEITARSYNPWKCPDSLCGDLLREIERDRGRSRDSWKDEPRSLRLGTGAPVVQMSTRNGAVTIREK